MSNQLRLAVFVLAYGGQVSSHHPLMWLEFGAVLGGSSERFALVAFGAIDVNPVDRARNIALKTAIERDADWMLMIDADTFVRARGDEDAGFQLLRMISDADRQEAGIVVAPVMPRAVEGDHQSPMVYRLVDGDLEEISLIDQGRRLVEIDSAATAVMAINVLKAVESESVFRFTDTIVEGGKTRKGLSEDHEFCRQMREAGFKIFADPRVSTGHMSRSTPINYIPG